MEYSSSFIHFLRKALEAAQLGKRAWRPMSTGEKMSVALALNRPEWLREIGYDIPEAIDRAGSRVSLVPQVSLEIQRRRQPNWKGVR